MSIFKKGNKAFTPQEISNLNMRENPVKSRYKLFIYTKDCENRTDLPLPRQGRQFISSKFGEVTIMQAKSNIIIVIGGGAFCQHVHASKLQYYASLGAKIYDVLKERSISKINFLEQPSYKDFGFMAYGLYLRSFNNGVPSQNIEIGNYGNEAKWRKMKNAALGSNFTRALINTPHGVHMNNEQNGLTVQRFATVLANAFPNCKIYRNREDLASINAGGILSVGRGSSESPALMEVTYCHPDAKDIPPSVFIAKGLMYDSGGAALKPAKSMANMKYDMSAAAIAAGMLKTLELNEDVTHVKVVFCIAENAIGENMVYNGDHVQMMDGKIVHNTNTDAEGRMVLYDGLVYAQNNIPNATCYLTMGTLTGLGKAMFNGRSALYFTPSEELTVRANAGNKFTGKMNDIFQLPDDPRTDISVYSTEPGVDLVNSQATIANGSEYAYKFLKAAVASENLSRYIHIDIGGGLVFGKKDITGNPLPYDSGTGWGVLLTHELFTL